MKILNNLKQLLLILISIASFATVSFADLWEMIQGDKLDKKKFYVIYIANKTFEPLLFGSVEVPPMGPDAEDGYYSYRTIADRSTLKQWVDLIDSHKQKSNAIEVRYAESFSVRSIDLTYSHLLDNLVQIKAQFDLNINCEHSQHETDDGGSLRISIYPEDFIYNEAFQPES